MNWLDKVRKGGDVTRYHSSNLIKQQDVAQHSYNAAMMAFHLAYGTSKADEHKCVMHMLVHDIPEQAIGDTPGPAKGLNPELKAALDDTEAEWCYANMDITMFGFMYELNAKEHFICKFCDLAECCYKFLQEISMGNKALLPDLRSCHSELREFAKSCPYDKLRVKMDDIVEDINSAEVI